MPDPVVHIAPVSGRTVLRLKSWLPEVMTGDVPVVLAGQELPAEVGATLSGPIHVLCTAPGGWLITSSVFTCLKQYVSGGVAQQHIALADVTAGLTVLDVHGPGARDVLSKGCGLDFHPRCFPTGRCAGTRLAQIAVLIDCVDTLPRFELYVSKSYSHYLQDWLIDGA